MKKLLGIVVLGLLWCNILPAKILNIENQILLEVPSSHEYIEYDNEDTRESIEEVTDLIEGLEIKIFLVGPSKYVEFEKAILDGEDLMENKYVKSIMKKAEKKRFKDEVQKGKWFISEAKKIMKKEKIDFVTYALVSNKSLTELALEDEGDEVADMITELQNMNNSELAESTKEIRKQLTLLAGNNKSILINDDMTINLNKFKIAKNEYGKLFLKSNGKMIWIMGTMKIDLMLNLFVTENNDKAYLFMSACYVNCSKFNSKFDKMIKPIISTNTQVQKTTSNISDSGDLAEQLKGLNELYKSGALTKEEFEKGKKKLLN
jgi:hypothetical protein|tara:strand:- start:460 stop:1416 length:957 start_codon:yes stop_codon:yes gene_type:complete